MDRILEIRLEKLVHGGDAMGRAPDGRPVFVPFAAPGDFARVEITGERKGFLRAVIRQLIEPSPNRIAPRCRHFGECGGCQLQHLAYPAQLAAKEAILREQLLRLGGIPDPALRPILPAPDAWRYRNHIQCAPAGQRRLGFHRAGSKEILPITECHLPEARLMDVWGALDCDFSVPVRQIGFRAADDGEMIVFEGAEGDAPEAFVEAPAAVAWIDPRGATVYLAGGPLRYEIRGRPFTVSAGSFFQVHTAQIPRLVDLVMGMAKPERRETAMDVYCGTGLFSAFLAGSVERLIGVEESPDSAEDFRINLDEFDNVELYIAPAERALEDITAKPDLAVADPPRTGLTPRAMRALLRLAPPRVVMVSCDAATLARDSRALSGAGYRLRDIAPVDLFPQTAHLETVSRWQKE